MFKQNELLAKIHNNQLLYNFQQFNNNFFSRNGEHGQQVVCSFMNDHSTILHMPRGNFEVIHPRSLVLIHISHLIFKKEFLTAIVLMKRLRIDMNFIVDFNIKHFVDNLPIFYDQIKVSEDNLNIFLTELKSNSVKYHDLLMLDDFKNLSIISPIIAENYNKIWVVSEGIRKLIDEDVMVHGKSLNFLMSTKILTFIKQNDDLESAIKYVVQTTVSINQAISNTQITNPTSISSTKYDGNNSESRKIIISAIKFLRYFVSEDRIFYAALSTYDLDVLLIVASQTNKDPKEYKSLINHLLQFDDLNYRKFLIDDLLKHPHRALTHLCLCENKDTEIIEYTEKNSLYSLALQCQINLKLKTRIAQIYGDWLVKNKYPVEAASVFSSFGFIEDALKTLKTAQFWQKYIDLVLIYKKTDINFMHTLKNELIQNGLFIEAADLIIIYFPDLIDEAIIYYLNGRKYMKACNYLELLKQPNTKITMQTIIKKEINTQIEILQKDIDDFLCRVNRLTEIRMNCANSIKNHENDFCDVSSYNSTTHSQISSSIKSTSTKNSMKKLKKLKKKFLSCKPGSQDEEFGLMSTLACLINKYFDSYGEWCDLLHSTVFLQIFDDGKRLITLFNSFVDLIDKKKFYVWLNDIHVFPNSVINQAEILESSNQPNSIRKIHFDFTDIPFLINPKFFKKININALM